MANNTIVINFMECLPVAFCLIAVLCVCYEKSTFTTFPKNQVHVVTKAHTKIL